MGYRDPSRGSQDELAEELAAELDGTLIDECLALSPSERLERLRKLLGFLGSARRSGGLSTTAGDLDLLGEVAGVGAFADVARDAVTMELQGRRVRVMSLDTLERAKRAAGRRRDLLDLAEIREIRRRVGS